MAVKQKQRCLRVIGKYDTTLYNLAVKIVKLNGGDVIIISDTKK